MMRPWVMALVFVSAALLLSAAESFSRDYSDEEARRSLLNPHEQINDEGDILWNKCLICHPEIPELVHKGRSKKEVRLRFENDLKQGCYRCHPERKHPGGEWLGRALGLEEGAPEHLLVPPRYISLNIRLSMKEAPVKFPMEPKSGKIYCATCHNPHERGLLYGRPDTGADGQMRLRSAGVAVCQYCHRK